MRARTTILAVLVAATALTGCSASESGPSERLMDAASELGDAWNDYADVLEGESTDAWEDARTIDAALDDLEAAEADFAAVLADEGDVPHQVDGFADAMAEFVTLERDLQSEMRMCLAELGADQIDYCVTLHTSWFRRADAAADRLFDAIDRLDELED